MFDDVCAKKLDEDISAVVGKITRLIKDSEARLKTMKVPNDSKMNS